MLQPSAGPFSPKPFDLGSEIVNFGGGFSFSNHKKIRRIELIIDNSNNSYRKIYYVFSVSILCSRLTYIVSHICAFDCYVHATCFFAEGVRLSCLACQVHGEVV